MSVFHWQHLFLVCSSSFRWISVNKKEPRPFPPCQFFARGLIINQVRSVRLSRKGGRFLLRLSFQRRRHDLTGELVTPRPPRLSLSRNPVSGSADARRPLWRVLENRRARARSLLARSRGHKRVFFVRVTSYIVEGLREFIWGL